jgi:hypothetical protein
MSDFKFNCPHCGQHMSGDDATQGSQIACPSCQETLTVPAPAASAPVIHADSPALASAPDARIISTSALLSLVCSFGLGAGSIPGIILGHIAKARIRRNPAICGKGLATTGLVLGYSFLICTLVFFTVGFVVLNPKQGRQITAKEEAASTPGTLAARPVDEVKIGDSASESEHGMKARFSAKGTYMDNPVRDAVNGGFISYVLKVDPARPMTLRCKYWGNDNAARRFDILVNDKVIDTQQLEFNDPGRFFSVEYDIPEILTRGKTEVTIVFQAYPGKKVGGIFGCQMLKR